jgi:hypothetical protein
MFRSHRDAQLRAAFIHQIVGFGFSELAGSRDLVFVREDATLAEYIVVGARISTYALWSQRAGRYVFRDELGNEQLLRDIQHDLAVPAGEPPTVATPQGGAAPITLHFTC